MKRSASQAFSKPSDHTESKAESATIEASSGSAESEFAVASSSELAGGSDEVSRVSSTTADPAVSHLAQAAVAASSLTPPLPLVADGDAAAGPPPESDYYLWHLVPSPVRRRPRLHRSQPIGDETWTLIEDGEDWLCSVCSLGPAELEGLALPRWHNDPGTFAETDFLKPWFERHKLPVQKVAMIISFWHVPQGLC